MNQLYPYRVVRYPQNIYQIPNQPLYYNNRNFENFLLGGVLGYGLGYFTPRPIYFYQPRPFYRPFW